MSTLRIQYQFPVLNFDNLFLWKLVNNDTTRIQEAPKIYSQYLGYVSYSQYVQRQMPRIWKTIIYLVILK